MADELNSSNSANLLNPMMLWTDLGMRALEITLSSSQNIGEGLDRLARAGAAADVTETAELLVPAAEDPQPSEDAIPGLALAAQMQRTAFEMMTQSWQQWIKMLGTLASIGAGAGTLGRTVTGVNPLLDAMRDGMQWVGAPQTGGKSRGAVSLSGQRASRSGSRLQDLDHAFAKAEPKRRRARAKPGSRARGS